MCAGCSRVALWLGPLRGLQGWPPARLVGLVVSWGHIRGHLAMWSQPCRGGLLRRVVAGSESSKRASPGVQVPFRSLPHLCLCFLGPSKLTVKPSSRRGEGLHLFTEEWPCARLFCNLPQALFGVLSVYHVLVISCCIKNDP